MSRGGVEGTRLEATDTKKFEAKAKDQLFEDRLSRGQGHRRKCTWKKRTEKIFSYDLQKKMQNGFQKFFRQSLKTKTNRN